MAQAIELKKLSFSYGERPVFKELSLAIPLHSRCLVLGANGVGKSTLLRLIAGKHLIKPGSLRVLGRDPFSGGLGPSDFTLVGDRFPLELDITVQEILESRRRRAPTFNHKLEAELVGLLGIDRTWRMHIVSNGQRRRVDVLLSLLESPRLILLDEVTSDLDIVVRQDLLAWLRARTRSKQATVIFATHILDGMAEWATHVVFLKPGGLRSFAPLRSTPGWARARRERPHSPLLWLAEKCLREDGARG